MARDRDAGRPEAHAIALGVADVGGALYRCRMDVTAWLLDSDPTLRWQVERDLLGAPREVWETTRGRIPMEGDGAALLARQDPDGQWAGGAFFPADMREDEDGQPWTATTWTLTTLREWGMDGAALAGTAEKLRANARWEYDDLPYWDGEVDVCINAMTLANGAWLGANVHGAGRVVPRASARRRRLELRVGRGLHEVVVPFHDQRAARHPGL